MKPLSMEEKFDMVLDAYLQHVLTPTELQKVMLEVQLNGVKLSRDDIVRLIVGQEIFAEHFGTP